MVVAAVDQYDLGIGVPQRVRRRDPGKAAADDYDALSPLSLRANDFRYAWALRLQIVAHGSPRANIRTVQPLAAQRKPFGFA